MKVFLIGLICIIFFSRTVISQSNIPNEETWTSSFGTNGPSCPLFRKRLANYYQRISEQNIAGKILQGHLSFDEIFTLVDLWKRQSMPLYSDATATFTMLLSIDESERKFFAENNSVEVSSALFNWVYDKFIFPESAMRVSLDDNNIVKFEVEFNYSQACLSSFPLMFKSQNPDGDSFVAKLTLDKYKWDIYNN